MFGQTHIANIYATFNNDHTGVKTVEPQDWAATITLANEKGFWCDLEELAEDHYLEPGLEEAKRAILTGLKASTFCLFVVETCGEEGQTYDNFVIATAVGEAVKLYYFDKRCTNIGWMSTEYFSALDL